MPVETPLVSTHGLFCAALQRMGGVNLFSHGPTKKAGEVRHSSFSRRDDEVTPALPVCVPPSEKGGNRWSRSSGDVAAAPNDTQQHSDLPSHEPTGVTAVRARGLCSQELMKREGAIPHQDAQARLHHLRFFRLGYSLEEASASESHEASGDTLTVKPTARRSDVHGIASELEAVFFEVAKEAVTAVTGRQLRAYLLGDDSTVGRGAHLLQPAQCSTAKAPETTTAARQVALHEGMGIFMNAVAEQEAMLNALAMACKTHLLADSSATSVPPACSFFSSLATIPMRQWAGVHLYNDWFVRCPTPDVSLPSIATTPKRSSRSGVPPPVLGSASRGVPKALVLPSDIEKELGKYWTLHNEAEARARLTALRSNDAEAFAKHISLLKVSSLLNIMERTEDFMRRIGLCLQSHVNPAAANSGCGGAIDAKTISTTPAATATISKLGDVSCTGKEVRDDSSDYRRFRAYVTSTKNEFKLIHSVDAFVETQPAGLDATLLPHQMDGLRFLASLDANHINGILADEMGVGKTIQTLAFFLYLKNRRVETTECSGTGRTLPQSMCPRLPHLVLAPLSVVREWREACAQFVSHALRVAVYQELADPVREAKNYDVVLLPIHAVRRVGAEASRIRWHYLVVDEAHKAVANLGTATARCILNLRCLRRLVLTGTPLSSDLQELWSLLFFLNPCVFADKDSFDEVFRRPFRVYEAREMELTEEERGLLILRLHQVLRPFLLRRTKADVDPTLRMTFHHLRCPLSAMQQRLLSMLREQRRTPAVLSMSMHKHSETSSSSSSEAGDEVSEDTEHAAGVAGPNSASPEVRMGCGEGVGHCQGAAAAITATETQPSKASQSLDTRKTPDEADTSSDAISELVFRYLPALARAGRDGSLRSAVRQDRALGLTSAGVSESTAQLLCNHAFLLPFFSQVLHRHGLDEVTWEGCGTADSIAPAAGEGVVLNDEAGGRCGAAGLTLACSGKFLLLHLLLSRLYVAQHKVVLFTHWLHCVDLLVDYLHSRGWAGCTEMLTGSSSEEQRVASVQRFREDPSCLFFILSVQAGGCGINLQVAHVVVLVDRDYTATNEDQALARVYRIGQRHTVRAVYLATTDVSEQRVAQRAAMKNKPRQAIINNGIYQVAKDTEVEQPEEPEKALRVAAVSDPCPNPANDLDACAVWSSVLALCTAPSTTSERQKTRGSDSQDVVHTSSVSAPDPLVPPEPFWVSLSRLVESMDQLVLTEEDHAAASVRSAKELRKDGDCAPTSSVVARLIATRPPLSTAELHLRLQRESGERLSHPFCDSERVLSVHGASAGDLSSAAGTNHTLASVAKEFVILADSEPPSAALAAPAALSQCTHPSAPTTDTQKNSALFWLEYCHLLRLAAQGPDLFTDSLDIAVSNDACENDTDVQSRRRERRARRAAKRMRLVSVDVPDSFRATCWAQEGIDDDEEVATLYLRHLDARTRKSRQRPRKDVV